MKLLQQAMQQSEKKKFLIDGFPRNEENRTAFENTVINSHLTLNLLVGFSQFEISILPVVKTLLPYCFHALLCISEL